MIKIGEIIQDVLMALGETSYYNDNTSDIYKVVSRALEATIQSIAADPVLLFNARTEKLQKAVIDSAEKDVIFYNVPTDLMSIVSSNAQCWMDSGFLASKEKDLTVQYCRTIDLADFPSYTRDLVIYAVARNVSLVNETFIDKFGLFTKLYEQEKRKVMNMAGFNFNLLQEDKVSGK